MRSASSGMLYTGMQRYCAHEYILLIVLVVCGKLPTPVNTTQMAKQSRRAGHGGIRSIMDDMTLLSTEAEGVNDTIPDDFKPTHVNSAGRVGALLGLTDDGSPSGVKPQLQCQQATAPTLMESEPPSSQQALSWQPRNKILPETP